MTHRILREGKSNHGNCPVAKWDDPPSTYGIHTVFGVKWGHFKWPKMNGFHWGYFTPISGVIIVTSFTTGRGPLVQSQCNHSQVRICAILLVPGSGKKIPSSKLTWQWKIPIFNREYIFNWSIFHCHVSLPEGNDCHD